MRFGPPHISFWFPPQVMAQSESAEASVPFCITLLPQKHCVLYSMPAMEYPAALQAPTQLSIVIVVLSALSVARMRPYALSTQHPP